MKRIGWAGGLLSLLIAGSAYAFTPTPPPPVSAPITSAQLNSQCVGLITIPSRVYVGEDFDATVRVRNTGSTRWRRVDNFKLGSPNLQFNMATWGVGSVAIPAYEGSVPRNDSVRFQFDPIAPATPGIYAFSWQMLQGNQLFGQVCTRNIEVQLRPNDADSISITGIPNRVETGQQFTVRITMKNNSRRTWAVGEYRLGSSGLMPSNATAEGSLRAYLHDPVPPNGRAVFDLPVAAPTTVTGSSQMLTLRWKMLQENVEWFGQAGSRQIRVYKGTNPTVTVTPTPTPTPVITPFLQFACLPRHQTAIVGQPVTVFEDPFEGNFSANWLAPDGNPTAGTGTSFTTTFNTAGDKTIAARSVNFPGSEKTDACTVTVTTGTVTPSPIITPTITPTPTPTPTPTLTPTPIPTETPTFTYVPNPYDGQTVTPSPFNGYDMSTVTPNPYTNPVISLTASFTSPIANTSFTRGQQIPITVVARETGSSSDLCGTWELVKPNGEVITLTITDFASEKLPRVIPPCVISSY